MWKDKIDREETIPHQLLSQWNAWKQDLERITKILLNRRFGFYKENDNEVELHVFCGAPTIVYGAVAYLKWISIDKDKPVCSFVMSKSWLGAMKEVTLIVPRPELQAAVLAVRLKLIILNQCEFPVSIVRLWSDSLTITKYIRTTSKKLQVFVMKRLHEIWLNSTIVEWNYIPGSENPAGTCTRYTPLQRLHPESVWTKSFTSKQH